MSSFGLFTGMKGAGFYGLRGKQLSLTLIALICTTILIWAWEKTPLIATFLPPSNRFEIHSPGILMGTPTADSVSIKQEYIKELPSDAVEVGKTIPEQAEKGLDGGTGILMGTPTSDSVSIKQEYIKELTSDAAEVGETKPEQAEELDVAPMGSTITSFSEEGKENMNFTTAPMENRGCNFANGKWVADSRRPFYSGFGCKQWLSEMWACRLTKRTYFSYEGFRWQPESCEMPEFERSTFLQRMRDKTVALIGDSLGRQQFQSLMCMVTGGKESPEVEDVGWAYGLVKARHAIRPDGWAYRFPRTNTTILYYWSASLCELEPLNRTDPNTYYAMHLDRPVWFLRHYLHRFDVVVLNTGHHWNRGKIVGNRWVMYIGGKPNSNRKLAEIGNAKNLTVYSVVEWLDAQLPKHPQLKAFFRTISPRHFVNGDWNSGGSCNNTIPLAGGSQVLQDGSSDQIAEGAVKGTAVKLLDITALSQLRDEAHISKYRIKTSDGMQDCLHWCLPGIPDTWNEILLAQI